MSLRRLSLALLFAFALPIQAGLFDDDEARKQIGEIRQNTQQRLQEQSSKTDQLDSRLSQKLVEVAGQMGELTQQIAQLRGQLEVLTFQLQGLQKRQQDLYVDLDNRMRTLEEGGGGAANPNVQAKGAQLEAEAASAYEAAYNQYREGKLKPASAALEHLVSQYSSTQAAPNALFWLGMAQAQLGDGGKAMQAWRKLVSNYPDHAKSPDALRAIASVQLEKGDRKGASKTLKEVISSYPGSPAAKEAEKQLKKM